MKKILILLCCLICTATNAQPTKFTKNLDAYVGTWEYSSATCTFRIYLKKGKSYANKGGTFWNEIVYGGHYIAYNGIVITDMEAAVKRATDQTRTENEMNIVASNAKEKENQVNPNVLTFSFRDDLKDKRGTGKLTLTPGNPAKLRWQILKTSEKIILLLDGEPMPVIHQGWTVPEDVVLTKIYDTIGPPKPKDIGPDDEIL